MRWAASPPPGSLYCGGVGSLRYLKHLTHLKLGLKNNRKETERVLTLTEPLLLARRCYKKFACHVGDPGLIPGLGTSLGEGHGNPLQYSCLEDSTDRGAWWATVHGVTKTQLSD